MARERGFAVNREKFEVLMAEQRDRGRKAQKREAVTIESAIGDWKPTEFVGYDQDECATEIDAIHQGFSDTSFITVLRSPLYAEMGGQVGDTGFLQVAEQRIPIVRTIKHNQTFFLETADTIDTAALAVPWVGTLSVDAKRRRAIERHHTVTHLLHWALHEVVSGEATQKGSYVGPEKLTFDFSSAALTKPQVRAVEKLVNDKIAENAPVSWTEIPYAKAKERADIMQFFGDKYGDLVRVVQIGGQPNELNGYSMELCGGTHVRATGDIGSFRIVREEAIAAGIRRIEAVAGDAALEWARTETARQEERFQALTKKKSDLASLPALDTTGSAGMLASIDARAAHLERIEIEVRESEKTSAKAAAAEAQKR
jgi:alanyl-tRNA synthetase